MKFRLRAIKFIEIQHTEALKIRYKKSLEVHTFRGLSHINILGILNVCWLVYVQDNLSGDL
jgi:hypothetical protein